MDLIPWRNNPNLNLHDQLQSLIEKMELLECKADDIKCQAQNEELQPSKKRKSEVTLWLKRVDELKQDAESIKAEVLVVENIDRRKSRALLSEMKGMMEHIDQLLRQGEFSQGLVLADLKPAGIDLVTTKLEGSTPLMVKDEVWSAFRNGESRIGIFGMGGVGKTTVAMHLNNEIVSGCRDCFNHVFYVTVSRGSTVHKLQHDISIALTLTLSNEDEARRAAELRMSLKRREKSLLILDDIWEDIRMEKVGVAVEGDGCRLLITTRKRDVCRKMSCNTIVEMKPLPQNEAWDLFVSTLGNYDSLNDATKSVARSIAEECAGLPLAIITIASCMRGECDEHEWRYMLRQLQNPSSNQDGMDEKVFAILKLSYERLSNDKLRQCLLYCALYDTKYELIWYRLNDYFIAVGLLRNEGTRKENIDEGHHILKALADASLITSALGNIIVKMHDLIRDMAVKIIGSKGIVKTGKGMKEMPRKEEWTKDLVLVFLMINSIQGVGDELSPECPNLSVLILCRNPLYNIPHSFFVHMEGLRYLDLSYTKIEELPDSVANLRNLNALLLKCCRKLYFIPSVAKLTKLRDLNLFCAEWIEELPEGVEELINLKYLDIRETMIVSIPEGVLCKLCKLESFLSNLYIDILPRELMSLRNLLRLTGRIDDLDALKQLFCSDCVDRLEEYFITVGYHRETFSEVAREVSIRGHPLGIRREVGFKVPHNVQLLTLKYFSFGVESLLEAIPSFCGAIELEIRLVKCKGIKYLISDVCFEGGVYEVSKPGKGKGVHRLKLERLDDFIGLYEGEAVQPHIFFGGLRELRINRCPSVKKILLQNDILPNLESIEVRECENLEEVFAIATTCLKSLVLVQLKELRSICGKVIFFPCLEKVRVNDCPKLEKLWSGNDELPSLKCVRVRGCGQLKEIIATTDEMEEIFEWGNEAGDDAIHLPNLEEIDLYDLPELTSICRKTIVCDSLKKITIGGEHKLKNCPISVPRLLLANKDSPLPTLETLQKPRDWWNSLYWNDPATKLAFDRLGCFEVEYCTDSDTTSSSSLESPCSSSDHH